MSIAETSVFCSSGFRADTTKSFSGDQGVSCLGDLGCFIFFASVHSFLSVFVRLEFRLVNARVALIDDSVYQQACDYPQCDDLLREKERSGDCDLYRIYIGKPSRVECCGYDGTSAVDCSLFRSFHG